MKLKKNHVQLSVRFPRQLHSNLAEYADKSGLYLNQVIIHMVQIGWKTDTIIQKYLDKIYHKLAQESLDEVFENVPPPDRIKEEDDIYDLDKKNNGRNQS